MLITKTTKHQSRVLVFSGHCQRLFVINTFGCIETLISITSRFMPDILRSEKGGELMKILVDIDCDDLFRNDKSI